MSSFLLPLQEINFSTIAWQHVMRAAEGVIFCHFMVNIYCNLRLRRSYARNVMNNISLGYHLDECWLVALRPVAFRTILKLVVLTHFKCLREACKRKNAERGTQKRPQKCVAAYISKMACRLYKCLPWLSTGLAYSKIPENISTRQLPMGAGHC